MTKEKPEPVAATAVDILAHVPVAAPEAPIVTASVHVLRSLSNVEQLLIRQALMTAQCRFVDEITRLFVRWAADRLFVDDAFAPAAIEELVSEYRVGNPLQFHQPAEVAPPEFIVDLDREEIVQVQFMHVKFRPGQRLSDPYVLALAEQHGIPLRPAPPKRENR